MRKEIGLGLAIACIALAAGGIYLLNRLDAQHEAWISEAGARQRAEARAKELEVRYRELEKSYADMLSERLPVVAPIPKRPENAPDIKPAAQNFSTGFDNRFTDVINIDDRPRGGAARSLNTGLVNALKLNEMDADKLLQILNDDQRRFRDALTRNHGNPLDAQAVDAMRSETERRLRDLLGEERYLEYEDYRKYSAEHQRVAQFNANLQRVGDTVLSVDQQQQLFSAMKEERNRLPQPVSSQYGSRTEFQTAMQQWRESYDSRVKERAATILSPEQLTTFRALRGPGRGRPERN